MGNFNWRSLFKLEGGSIWLILAGLVLAIKPDLATAAVSAVLGWVLILCGVVTLVVGFVVRLGLGTIISGGLLLAAGSWLHRSPMMIATVLGLVVGGLLLSQGFEAVGDALRLRRRGGFWISTAVIAVLMALLGLRMIFSPLGLSRLAMRLAGITMVICGITNRISHSRAVAVYESGSNIIDAEE